MRGGSRRRRGIVYVGVWLVAALGALHTAAGQPGPDGRPNIVLIYADDLGWGDLGSYGHPRLQTPHLDRLAAEGMRFTAYYAPSPLCSPSRAGLLTGRTPFRTGIESWIPQNTDVQLGPDEITLATLLQRVDYQTAMFGKWHLNGGLEVARHTSPSDHGFESWLALHAFPLPHNRNPTNFHRDGEPLGMVPGYTAQIVADAAIEWLAGRDRDRPFFLYLPVIEPHSTIANPPEINALYAEFTRGAPEPFVNGLPEPPDNLEARGPGEYWANITMLDRELGRVLEAIDDAGLRNQTVVVFASDNGPVTTDWRHWWEVNLYGDTGGMRGRKADLYEGGIRVPAMVRWPGRVAAGVVADAPVSGYDLLPTLAAVAGVAVPDDRPIDGEDFGPLLRGEPWRRARPLYWEFDDDRGFHYALRDGRWKLLADERLERVELYDLEADPFELRDLAASEVALRERLLSALRARAADVAADPLRPDTGPRS